MPPVPARPKFQPRQTGGLVGALITALLGFVLLNLNLPIGKKPIHLSYDLPFLIRPVEIPDDVRMVYLNDEAHHELKQPYTAAWDRNYHVRLLEKLTADHARAVIFDIVFSDADPENATDRRLAEAIRNNGRVILAGDDSPGGFAQVQAMKLTRPAELFRKAAAGWGISQLDNRPDFEVRRHYHGPMSTAELTLGESWAAANLCGVVEAQDPANRPRERWVNYYGPPGSLPGVGLHQAILSDGVPLGYFSNKVVFVGAYLGTVYSGERKDEFKSPWSVVAKSGGDKAFRLSFMPGAEVHATIFLNLLRGDWLRRSPAIPELIGVLLLGLGFGYGLVNLRPLFATLTALLAMLLVTALACFTFMQWHFWFPWLVLVVQVFVAMNYAVIFNSIQLYVQKKLYEQTLSLYISPKLVKRFAADPEKAQRFLRPGAEKQTVTVVFTDIANFTSISEGMDSDDLCHHMNRYFQQAVSNCIHSTDGTVVKYIGDAIFAFWNAPEAQVDHALRACRAALSFRDQPVQEMNGRPLITRIGLHTGVANVGNFGSTERVDYTALGENINLASRMEGLNKYLGTTVLATGDTMAAARDRIVARFCGVFRLKGFEKSVEVYELVDPTENADQSRAWRQAFDAALEHFRKSDFASAEIAFRRVLELRPDDGPTKFFLHKLEEFRAEPPPEGWKGEVELKEK
jgi:adenylate cyclase